MAPIRRYLRITKYSVLELRIYPDTPSDAPWLLSNATQPSPVLPRIVSLIRPKILPKLREENENAKKKTGKKKKGIRDVAVGEDFEVVMFLTEMVGRYSLIAKKKTFGDGGKGRLKGNGGKLTGWLGGGGGREEPLVMREDDEEDVKLDDIAEADTVAEKRKAVNGEGDEDEPYLLGSSEDEALPASKRLKRGQAEVENGDDDGANDDKKKLALNTSYDGFSIYGRILCLIVKRKGKKTPAHASAPAVAGSQMMENWVSTQAAQETGLDDED
nr:hypothetical protein B0A51_13118 [Rachicladosporium sp. CCFEE 5018]